MGLAATARTTAARVVAERKKRAIGPLLGVACRGECIYNVYVGRVGSIDQHDLFLFSLRGWDAV
jgi:hypothetical protein